MPAQGFSLCILYVTNPCYLILVNIRFLYESYVYVCYLSELKLSIAVFECFKLIWMHLSDVLLDFCRYWFPVVAMLVFCI